MPEGQNRGPSFIRVAIKEFFAKFQLFGADSAGVQAALRANDERNQLQVEPVENWIETPPVVLGTSANTAIYNPGSTATEALLVDVKLVNYGSSASLTHLGLDVTGTGTLTHYWFRSYIPVHVHTDWLGPFLIGGDDDVMAWAGDATTIVANLRMRKVLR